MEILFWKIGCSIPSAKISFLCQVLTGTSFVLCCCWPRASWFIVCVENGILQFISLRYKRTCLPVLEYFIFILSNAFLPYYEDCLYFLYCILYYMFSFFCYCLNFIFSFQFFLSGILNLLPSHTTNTCPCSHTSFLLFKIGYFLQVLLMYFLSLWSVCYLIYRHHFSYIKSTESLYLGLGLNLLV